MTKRSSEGELGAALRSIEDLDGLIVYKPPDDARNWKPADFMVWWLAPKTPYAGMVRAAWLECKDVTSVNTFAKAELRPSQIKGIRDAAAAGLPYFLCVYWRLARRWTISDAIRVYRWFAEPANVLATSIPRELLMSRFGIDAAPRDLAQTLKIALTGELG